MPKSTLETRIEVLTEMFTKQRKLQPSALVKAARVKSHPLHDDFEWDDKVAGHQYRLQQARNIIKVTPIMQNNERVSLTHVPVAVVTDGSREGEYLPNTEIVKDPDKFTRAMDQLVGHMTAVQASIAELRACAGAEELPVLSLLMEVTKNQRQLIDRLKREMVSVG